MSWRKCVLLLVLLLCTRRASAYGVLAHEAVVDAAWERSLVPLLRARFHPSTAELQEARAFAYGGCLIQDLGYYPFSSRTFGDLTHYVRTGDFVAALLEEASSLDEYAFALGALSHYAGDNDGHPLAVNPAVALIYPKLRAKFGPAVTYEDNPTAHLKTEFGFDVVQISHQAYLSTAFHDFVGFQVAKPVLERAFQATYGLELKDVFADFDLAVGTYRYAIGTMIPQMTKVAWQTRRDEIERISPGVTQTGYLFKLRRQDYEREFGTHYDRPGLRSKLLAIVLRVIPKVGPFRSLSFRLPTPEAERLFIKSFSATVDRYRQLLSTESGPRPTLRDLNFDIGRPVKPGDYRRADEAYEDLLARLQRREFQDVPVALRADLLAYFGSAAQPAAPKALKRWRKIQASVNELRAHAAN